MTPYFGGAQIPAPRNALVGMSGPQRLTTNALQPQGQRFPQRPPPTFQMAQGALLPSSYGGYGGGYGGPPGALPPAGYGAHPMMYQPMPGQIPQGQQWPNPHAGAYQEWLQRFRPGPNQMLWR